MSEKEEKVVDGAACSSAGEYKLELIVDKSHMVGKLGPLHYIAMFLWLGWFAFFMYFPVLFVGLMMVSPVLVALLVIAVVTSAIYPLSERLQPKWGWALGDWLMRQACDYFAIRVFCEDYKATNESGPAMVIIEPHDILPVALFAYSNAMNYFPGHKIRGCLTSACFSVPGMRHIYTWARATSVDRKSINRLLEKKCTPTLCPGGAHEVTFMTSTDSDEVVLYLRSRLGMIKIAAQHGVPIIPSFAFNQRPAYSFFVPQSKLLHKIGRKLLGFIPLFFFGAGNIPFGQPKPCPITLVVGKPIPIPKMEGTVDKEMLQPYLDEVIASIERIYEKNKEQFGMGHIKLKIL